MVYTVNLKWLSFKMDISSPISMLNNQESTYAILRYAYDIPSWAYEKAMEVLISAKESINYGKLKKLVSEYESVSKIQLLMEDEFEESIILTEDDFGRLVILDDNALIEE